MNFEESIKRFRAYDTKNEKFAFVGFHILGEVTLLGALDIYKHENSLSLDETLELKITEFTGAKDSNCLDIYEGDILSSPQSHSKSKHLVQKVELDWVVVVGGLIVGTLSELLSMCKRANYQIHVVGNIYENANLLN